MDTDDVTPDTPQGRWSPWKVGLAYVNELVVAVRHAQTGNLVEATEHAVTADALLLPLGNSLDGEEYRAFIAGAAAATDHYLRQLAVPLPWDG